MFNALNRFISRLDGDSPPNKENHGAFGFQVLRNENLQLGIEPWFDFIVGINGRMIDDSDPRLFSQEVRNCAGGSVTLGLWSAKGQRTRTMQIPVPADKPSIGVTLQWMHLSVASNIWHVLDVSPNSPADAAGMLPYSDYILGTPEGVLHGEGGLGELVEDHIGRPLRLYVYNNEYDVTREVTIQPSRDWGGEGALGCVLGYGALHRLPAPLSEPVSAPGETLFDGGGPGPGPAAAPPSEKTGDAFVPAVAAAAAAGSPVELLVPAQMVGGAPAPAPPRSKRREKQDRGGPAPGRMMDDYFKEEEQRSRELDHVPTGGRGTPVAPPPTVPPPPKAAATPARGATPTTPGATSAPGEGSGASSGSGGE